jgi:excisionase family DNA binding protein
VQSLHPGSTGRAPIEPLGMRVNDAAQAIGVCRSTIYNWANTGRIKIIHVGKKAIVDYASLKALFDVEA